MSGTRHAGGRAALLASALSLLILACVLGCGGGGLIFISFNSGLVVGEPSCRDGTGHFDLLDQEGLLILVVINSSTKISTAGGFPGTCTDVTPNAHAQVRGRQRGNTMTADAVNLG
jgi:hypothetical protein